jgi:predicted ATPase
MLEALGRLCREGGGQQIIALLRQYAPTWLAQLPGVIPEEELQALQLQVQGSTQQRMLREMAEAIEVGTARRPLVLILEDLHWSDHSTLELLAYLARRRQRARLLIVATYRPADVVLRAHPLKEVKQELQAHGQCEELRLELLTKEDITEYLAQRFPGSALDTELTHVVYEHTEGNPLFMVNVVEELLRQGVIVEQEERWELRGDVARASVPDTLRQLIEKQSAQLQEEERHILEAASVAGTEFTVAAVAAALKQDMDEVETICEEVAGQGHFLEERGIAEWPDGTMSGRYSFRHALYQNVLYERIAEARRMRLHRLIGERLEAGYGSRAHEIAAELAVHFERGHDYRRAVHYLEQAGKNTVQRSAHREAIGHLTKGLELLQTLPDTPERVQQELTLQIALGVPLMATKGYAVLEVEKAYRRARELCQQIGEAPQLFSTLQGLFAFYLMRGDLQAGCELADQCHSLAQSANNPTRRLWAHHGLAQTSYFRGEFALAREQAEQGIALYDSQKRRPPASGAVQDPGVACRSFAAFALWFLGYPDQAWQRCQDALTLAHELSHPLSLAFALSYTAIIHNFRQEPERAQSLTETLIRLCREHEFPFWLAWGMVMQGWSLAEQGQAGKGIAQIQEGLAACRATGADMWRPWFLTVAAAAYEKAGQIEPGLTALAEALTMAEKNGERLREAELYRLKGELTLQQENQKAKIKRQKSKIKTDPRSLLPDAQVEAEACFLKAIKVARQQQAKSLELRAVMSLSRLWQQQGKQHEARNTLAAVYNWFTEGFDTKDLQEAKTLLEEL